MRKLWTFVFAAGLIAGATPPAQASQVQSALSGLCIQPEGGPGAWNGAVIRQVPCDPNDASLKWFIKHAVDWGGRAWFYIENGAQDGQLCLDLTDGNTADRTPLQVWECTSRSSTMWWTFGDGRLINFRSRKCVDVRAGSLEVGAVIQNYRCAELPDGRRNLAQIWNFE